MKDKSERKQGKGTSSVSTASHHSDSSFLPDPSSFSPARLGSYDYGCKDCQKLPGFVVQWIKMFLGYDGGSGKKSYPVARFLELLQGAFEFADEISVRFGSVSFCILRAR